MKERIKDWLLSFWYILVGVGVAGIFWFLTSMLIAVLGDE